MEFRVLGPLQVEDQGWLLPLGGPAERHLLAVLVCLANETVPVTRLIDELWGEEPPATARNMVQRGVSRLRRSLGDRASTRLVTEAGGYRLCIGEEELDGFRFEALMARARRLEDPHATAELLGEALDMWRGPPFVGAGDGPTVVAERVRFEEARLTALEDRIDCDLELGCHRDLVPELEGLTGQFPLRERLRGQLMVALYQSDRQTEALRSYADYRQRLGEETGLEPSPVLAQLEQRILLRSPDLDPPRAASSSPRTNLPHRLTRFIGRRGETEAVVRMVSEHRLLTLTGAAGIGKTSLAIRAAGDLLGSFPDGVWFVELGPLTDPDLIGNTVARSLDVAGVAGEAAVRTLARELTGSTLLLILDNCEHLVTGSAEFTDELLLATEHLRVLATSREPLGVGGEALLRVSPLEVPSPTQSDPAQLERTEAVALFVDRARLLEPEFALDRESASVVAEICRRLDGLPLAIELAAARLGTMTPHQIAARLHDRFGVLTKGARTAPSRQQTLKTLVDWSHELLTARQQAVFRRSSVFLGGFDLGAAAQVCNDPGGSEEEMLDPLSSLVECSMVETRRAASGAIRYGLLETFRLYGQARLKDSGEDEAVRIRHADYFMGLAEQAWAAKSSAARGTWLRRLEEEHDNLRGALDQLKAEGRGTERRRLCGALGWFWDEAGFVEEGADRIAECLPLAKGEDDRLAARLYLAAAHNELLSRKNDYAHPALELYERVGDRVGAARVKSILGSFRMFGDISPTRQRQLLAEAIAVYREEGLLWDEADAVLCSSGLAILNGDRSNALRFAVQAAELFAELGDEYRLASSWMMQASARHHFDDPVSAIRLQEKANALLASSGPRVEAALGVLFLAEMWLDAGEPDLAIPLFRQAVATFEQHRSHRLWVTALTLMGLAHRAARRLDETRRSLKTAMDLALLHYEEAVPWILDCAAGTAAQSSDGVTAAKLFGATERWREDHQVSMYWWDHLRYDPDVQQARGATDPDTFQAAWHEGRSLSILDAAELAAEKLFTPNERGDTRH